MIRIATITLKELIIKLIIVINIIISMYFFVNINIDIEEILNLAVLKRYISKEINIYKRNEFENKLTFLKTILDNEHILFNYKNNEVIISKTDNNIYEENNIDYFNINDINNSEYSILYDMEKVDFRNETDYSIKYNELINKKISINKETSILIIHTHASESYYGEEHTDYFRSEDKEKNMICVGDELESILKNLGYNVIHDRNIYDYPTYNGSYTRTLVSIENYLKNDENIGIVLDIHRDAVSNKPEYGPTAQIDENTVSKIMFVVGTNGGGLEHNNWKENLSFALKLQSVGEQIYPGLFRQMSITNSRYNQHATKGSLIVEVGCTGNTLEQSILSIRYFAKILDVVLNKE